MNRFSSQYWEKRYAAGQDSGVGSYNKQAEAKAEYVNNIITQYNIKTVNDYGHGDGNQLTYLKGFEKYYGYDVSQTVRDKCKVKFNDNCYTFVANLTDLPPSDLALSLDVIYHLVEDKTYEEYMKYLFLDNKYVVIYSTNEVRTGEPNHCRCRHFTPYVKQNFLNYELIEEVSPYHPDVKMYLYAQIRQNDHSNT